MKQIIVYFSRAHMNYMDGRLENLEVGNTEVAANILQKLTGADMFKLEPEKEYSHDYSKCIEEAKRDLQCDARPALKTYPHSLDEYDVIYLGYPKYWGTMPMAVFTFLEKYDFSGKTIKPFCTHEGSGLGKSEIDIQYLCPNAETAAGLAIRGTEAAASEELFKNWI